jgi:hypothetical protein
MCRMNHQLNKVGDNVRSSSGDDGGLVAQSFLQAVAEILTRLLRELDGMDESLDNEIDNPARSTPVEEQ